MRSTLRGRRVELSLAGITPAILNVLMQPSLPHHWSGKKTVILLSHPIPQKTRKRMGHPDSI
jgi:hypothetical protein